MGHHDLLKNAQGFVAIEIFGDRHPGQSANVGQALVGEIHVLEGEAMAAAAHLAEAAADPQEEAQQALISTADAVDFEDLFHIANLLLQKRNHFFIGRVELLNNGRGEALDVNRAE